MRRRRAIDRGFVLSDHADWPGLLRTVNESGAKRVWTTHGYSDVFASRLRESGYDADRFETSFVGEMLDEGEQDSPLDDEAMSS